MLSAPILGPEVLILTIIGFAVLLLCCFAIWAYQIGDKVGAGWCAGAVAACCLLTFSLLPILFDWEG